MQIDENTNSPHETFVANIAIYKPTDRMALTMCSLWYHLYFEKYICNFPMPQTYALNPQPPKKSVI